MNTRTLRWLSGLLLASIPHMAFSPSTSGEVFPAPEELALNVYSDLQIPGLNQDAFMVGYRGFSSLIAQNDQLNDSLITIIDFSLPSSEKRLYVIDIKNNCLLEHTLVAHGMGSGGLYARQFSNQSRSHMSSLGFYMTSYTYTGKHGYSLRLQGLEKGINDNAWKRAIVVHGAHYVDEDYIAAYGRLGRSFGCPALPYGKSREVIDLIRDNTCLFIYYPEKQYLENSGIIRSFSDYPSSL